MPFVAGKRACPSALSRPRGWRLSKRSAEPWQNKRADQAQGLARKGRAKREIPKGNLCERMAYRSREAAGRRNWPEAVPRKMSGRKRMAIEIS